MYIGFVLLVFVWLAIRSRYVGATSRPQAPPVPRYVVPLAAFASCALVIAQLASSYYVAAIGDPCYFHMPIATVGDGESGTNVFWQGAVPVAIGFAQAGLLLLLYFGIRSSPGRRWMFPVACSAAISAIAAVLVPVMTSPDPLVYVSYANLGFSSYAANLRVVDVPHLPLAAWCTKALVPNVYGPMFLVYVKLLVGWMSNATAAVRLIRITNIGWFALTLLAMRASRIPSYAIALTAINPVFFLQYVSGAHNDIISIALLMTAAAVAERSIVTTFLLVVLTGLFKIPLVAVGAVAFANVASAWKRVVLAVSAGVAAAAISYWWAGPLYLAGMQRTDALLAPTADRLQLLTALLGLGALAAAVLWKRYVRAGPFAISTIAFHYLPAWYMGWGLPYAAAAGSGLVFYLVALPIASIFADETVSRPAQLAAFAVVVLAVAASLVRDMSRRSARPA